MIDSSTARRVRSFVLRGGRMTTGQQRAFDTWWPAWGLSRENGVLDPEAAFGRRAPLVLEIGFGMGQSLAAMAVANPATNYLGVEVHPPGVGRLFAALGEAGATNVRVYRDDAVEVLEHCIADGCLDGVQIFFPDPWHKKRHHKRRLIQPPFAALLVRKLAPTGWLHLATDWEPYAEQMLEVLDAQPGLVNRAGPGGFSERPEHRPLTKFEQRGQRLGHGVWDLVYDRRA